MWTDYFDHKDIRPVVTGDLVQNVLEKMAIYDLRELPVVEENQYQGLISEEDLLDLDQSEVWNKHVQDLNNIFIMCDQHINEAVKLMTNYKLSLLPIVDQKNHYVGVITKEGLFEYLAQDLMYTEAGSIIVLNIQKRDYSLNEISRLIESESSYILGVSLRNINDKLELTLKLGTKDVAAIVATLERLSYSVVHTYEDGNIMSSYQENYDYFMNYLDV
jgi:predicted transcriptional regulator